MVEQQDVHSSRPKSPRGYTYNDPIGELVPLDVITVLVLLVLLITLVFFMFFSG